MKAGESQDFQSTHCSSKSDASPTLTDIALGELQNIPFDVLQAEFHRRKNAGEQPSCGSKGTTKSYNTPLHVFALVLILALSTLGHLINCSLSGPFTDF